MKGYSSLDWRVVGCVLCVWIVVNVCDGSKQSEKGNIQKKVKEPRGMDFWKIDPSPAFNSIHELKEFVFSHEEAHILANRNLKRSSTNTPVVIVPSMVGSVIQAKLNNVKPPDWYCRSNYDTYYYLWLDEFNFYPLSINCWAYNFQLQYNSTSGFQSNQTGVESMIPDWGGINSISYLDPNQKYGVWNDTIAMLESVGYTVGRDLFGAPYDWRVLPTNYFDVGIDGVTPNPDFPYYANLKLLIEQAYQSTGKKVVVLSLSMGGPVFVLFLNQYVDQTWKDKYIESYVSLDGAFGGSVSAVQVMISTQTWLSMFGSGEILKPVVQSLGAVVWFLPDPIVFGPNRSFVGSPSGNYTADQYYQLLNYVNATVAAEMWEVMVKQGYIGYESLGIPVHVVHGVGVPTPEFIAYNTTDFSNAGVVSFENGDGTILLEGLTVLAKYNSTEYPVYLHPIEGMQHGESVHNPLALKIVLSVVLKSNLN